MIVEGKRKGRKVWKVKSRGGKVLGTHTTKKAALKQLAAVEISKRRRAGEKIQKKKR